MCTRDLRLAVRLGRRGQHRVPPASRALSVPPSLEAVNVNALDEVPDSSWFENRLGRHGMTLDEIALGPCSGGKVLDENELGGELAHRSGQAERREPGLPGEGTEGREVHAQVRHLERAGARDRGRGDRDAALLGVRLVLAVRQRRLLRPGAPRAQARPQGHRQQRRVQALRHRRAREAARQRGSRRGERVRMVASRWLPGRAIGPFNYERQRATTIRTT